MLREFDIIFFRQYVQPVLFKICVDRPRQLESIDDSVLIASKALLLICSFYESHIKARIMRNKDRVPDPVFEFCNHFTDRRCIDEHIIGDTGNSLDRFCQWFVRIAERLVAVDDFATLHFDTCKLDDFIVF